MKKNKFTLLVFDWDGTLMDSVNSIIECVGLAATDLNLEIPTDDAVKNIIGLGLKEAVTEMFPGADDPLIWQIVERYRIHFVDKRRTPAPLFPGAENTVRHLADMGYLLAVATGKGRSGLDKVFKYTGMGELFHTSRCADEGLSKPNPDMLMQIMDELGTKGNDTLMIGDTEYDMNMARNAGAKHLAVSYGSHTKERLMLTEPLGCLDDIRDLPEWLQDHETS